MTLREKKMVFGGGGVIAIALLLNFVLLPLMDRWSIVNESLADTKLKLEKTASRQRAATLSLHQVKTEHGFDLSVALKNDEEGKRMLLKHLSDLARKQRLSVDVMQFQKEKKRKELKGVTLLPLVIKGSGATKSVLAFIQGLRESPLPVEVNSMTVAMPTATKDRQKKVVDMQLSLIAYCDAKGTK